MVVWANSFSELVRLFQRGQYTSLGVSYDPNPAKEKELQQLANLLSRDNCVEELRLHGVSLDSTSARRIAVALRWNSTLKLLSLTDNKIGDKGADAIAAMLKVNHTLTHLYLTSNGISDEGIGNLGASLKENETLEELYLAQNKLTFQGALKLARVFETNTTVTSVSLDSNNIGDVGAQSFVKSLDRNFAVVALSIEDNKVTDDTMELLRCLLERNQNTPDHQRSEVGQLLVAYGFGRVSQAFHDAGILKKYEAAELGAEGLERLGVTETEDQTKLSTVFGPPMYSQTPVGQILTKHGLSQYAKLLHKESLGTLEVAKSMSPKNFEEIGVSDKKDAQELTRIFSQISSSTTVEEKFDCFLSHNWSEDETGRYNHDAVSKINEALKKKGLKTWFDAERMEGFVLEEMTRGIDNSAVIIVFVTKRYIKKVKGKNSNDNCKIEFNYAYRLKSEAMISVPMEEAALPASKWTGPVGAVLGGKVYEACFAFDIDSDKEQFMKEVDELYQQIKRVIDHQKA